MYAIIDTGLNGAVVFFDSETKMPVDSYLMEPNDVGINANNLYISLAKYSPDTIYIERVPAMPKQSVNTTAKQFFVVGQIYATVMRLRCPLVEVWPATWTSFVKRVMGSDMTSKKLAQVVAKKYYPIFSKHYTPRSKIHDGVADCLAINIWVNMEIFADEIVEEITLN